MKALYRQQSKGINDVDWQKLKGRLVATIRFFLNDDVTYHVMDKESPVVVWTKLESRYMSRLLSNKLYLKQKLFGLKILKGTNLNEHVQSDC